MEVRPGIIFPFGKNESVVEEDLERSDLRVDYILVGVGIDVLILSNFERNEVIGDHIADNFQLRVSFGDHFGD